MMYTYSIMPLTESGFDEIVEDIKGQVERGISIMPLFKFVPIAEGTPVWNKIGPMCALYAKYRDALSEFGIKSGVLVQSTIGHGWALVKTPFQRYVNLTDGQEANNYCPEDPAFAEHLCDIIEKIASESPAAIMIDDDFRLTRRAGKGCACERHMKKLNDLTGRNFTREQLWDYIDSHPMSDEINTAFLKVQHDSLIELATKIRETIDSVNPEIQGIICASGDECNLVATKTAKILAGKGNPSIVRMSNGVYAPYTDREHMARIAWHGTIASKFFKKNGIDVLLAEADTIPFNRYAKSAGFLHCQYALSILAGATGAKHWITRFATGELKSGKAYRDILAKNKGFYEKLADFAKNIRWVGANQSILPPAIEWYKRQGAYHDYLSCDWTKLVLERMGIPFYFSDEAENANFIEEKIAINFSDEQIEDLFDKTVFITSSAAEILTKRGFEKYLGVEVSDQAVTMGTEIFDKNPECCCTKQKGAKILIPFEKDVEVLSHNYVRIGQSDGELYPAVTRYKNQKGGTAIVYCGGPLANFTYTEGFAFLNETRKNQFIKLLKDADALPVYMEGDNEVLLCAGYIENNKLLVNLINLGFDTMEETNLYLEKEPEKICMLLSDGSEKEVEFTRKDTDIYSVSVSAKPLDPVVLIVK